MAKALRARRAEIIEDTGGEKELSRVKSALIDRFVWLECILQTWELEMVKADDTTVPESAARWAEDAGRWMQAVNTLNGLASKIGLEKRSQAAFWLAGMAETPAVSNGSKPQRQALPYGLKEMPPEDADDEPQ